MQGFEQAGFGEGHSGGEVAVGSERAGDVEADDEDAAAVAGEVADFVDEEFVLAEDELGVGVVFAVVGVHHEELGRADEDAGLGGGDVEVGDHLAEVFALDVVVEAAGVLGVGEPLVFGVCYDGVLDEVRESFVFVGAVEEREDGSFACLVFRMSESGFDESEVQIFLPEPGSVEEDSVDAVGGGFAVAEFFAPENL